MSKFIIIWTVAGFGMKSSEGLSIETLLLQDEHQLVPMGKVQRNSTNDEVRTAVVACRDFLPFPPIDLAVFWEKWLLKSMDFQ